LDIVGSDRDLPDARDRIRHLILLIVDDVSARAPSARNAYAGGTAERRWSGLSDDCTGSGGTSG
jgi:hypothetical protein